MNLTPLGVSDEAEALLAAVIGHDVEAMDRLKQSFGLPAYRAAIQNLLDCRLIAQTGEGAFEAVNPVLAIEALIERRSQELLDLHRDVLACRAAVARFHKLFDRERELETIETGVQQVIGLDAVRESLAELAFFARSGVMSVQPGGPQSAEAIEASRPLDHRAIRRGLKMRVIHERSVFDDELNRGYLRELTELGVEARVSDRRLDRMVIFDSAVAVVPLDPRDSRAGALIVRQPGLVSGFVGLFEQHWDLAEDLPWDHVDEGPTDTDTAILTLLAKGATDEQIAREIAISVRHLRRHISRLMQRLNASSRFEAGVEATRRGWL